MMPFAFRARSRWLAVAFIFLLGLATEACAANGAIGKPPAMSSDCQCLPNFTRLVARSAPAVVSITGVRNTSDSNSLQSLLPNLPPDSPLWQFFQKFFDQQSPPGGAPQPGPQEVLGSGFIISPDGYIVTNRHVVKGDSEIKVRLLDRREYTARIIGTDKRTDLALIKINAKHLPTLSFGDSNRLKVGQWVLAIGNPFGFDYSATQGIISALKRNLPNDSYVPFIQTDAAVNPGNSGGPLLDLNGHVIGVISQIYTNSGGFMGLSFAIPGNIVKNVVAQIEAHGHVTYGWLGVMVQDMNQNLAEAFGLKQLEGALIAQVMPDSPAARAGLRAGDIILKFNGHPIYRSADLPPLVGSTPVGSTVPVEILRNGQRMLVDVTIAALKTHQQKRSPAPAQAPPSGPLGMALENLTPEQRQQLGVGDRGILISNLNPNGVAAQNGLQPGDIILQFGATPVHSVRQFERLIHEAPRGRPIAILIMRQNTPLYTTLTLPKWK